MRPFAQAARRIHPGSTSWFDRYCKRIALDGTLMPWPLGILLFLVTVIGMEAFAYAAHRWVMHGPGWFLHASHHRRRRGAWELNDLYAAIFAVPSVVLLLGGL
jgi:hypothetical protein